MPRSSARQSGDLTANPDQRKTAFQNFAAQAVEFRDRENPGRGIGEQTHRRIVTLRRVGQGLASAKPSTIGDSTINPPESRDWRGPSSAVIHTGNANVTYLTRICLAAEKRFLTACVKSTILSVLFNQRCEIFYRNMTYLPFLQIMHKLVHRFWGQFVVFTRPPKPALRIARNCMKLPAILAERTFAI